MVSLDRLSITDTEDNSFRYDEAKNYIKLANKFLFRDIPCLITIGGRSGSGKSTLAKEIAPQLGTPPGSMLLRSDVYRKLIHGSSPLQKLEPVAYTQEDTNQLYETLLRFSENILTLGKSVIVDASFLNPEHRTQFEDLASKLNVRFLGIWLKAPKSVLTERVNARVNDASDADSTIVEQQFKLDTDPQNWLGINTEGSLSKTLSRLKAELRDQTLR